MDSIDLLMNFALVTQFPVFLVSFNQKKVIVGAFFVIVKTDCETDGLFAALVKKMSVHAAMASCVNI